MTATRPSFYILDAFNLIFQVFHAIPEMTGPAGQPTQAVFGIYRDLLNLVQGSQARLSGRGLRRTGPRVSLGHLRRIQGEPQGNARRSRPADPGDPRVFEGFRVPVIIEPGWRPTT